MEYDGWATRYDEDTARFGWRAPQVVLDAVAELGLQLDAVLDLGIGTGQCSRPLARAGAQVVGIDASEAMLEQARAAGDHAELHHLRLGQESLQSVLGQARFDLVVSCGVLHFVADLGPLFAQVFDVLRPQRSLVFTSIPPQERAFSSATHVRPDADIAAALEGSGFEAQAPRRFVAYHAQGDRADPVHYTLWVAQRRC